MNLNSACHGCRNGAHLDFPITMAFQPIVSTVQRRIQGFEALVRGVDGAGAGAVLARVSDDERYAFDQGCRTAAISMAAQLGLAAEGAYLSINFLPNAVYDPRACIRVTLAAAREAGFPTDRIQFEFTEGEKIDTRHLLNILKHYRDLGFRTAIDDFGAGYAGVGLLTSFIPDVIKIDMKLVRDCDTCSTRRTILRHQIAMMEELGVEYVCEGVETQGEFEVLRDMGVDLMQGYLFAAPGFETLPEANWSPIGIRQPLTREANLNRPRPRVGKFR